MTTRSNRRGTAPHPAFLGVAVVVVLCLIGGAAYLAVSSWLDSRPRERCWSHLPNRHPITAAGHTVLLLVDLNSNSPEEAEQVALDLQSAIHLALLQRSVLALFVDPGAGRDIVASPCLDSAHEFTFDAYTGNEESLRRARATTESAILTHIQELIARIPIGKTGSPLRLLNKAYAVTRLTFGEAQNRPDVVIWTDFLSNAHDCLDIGDAIATQIAADSVDQRCTDSRSLPRLPGSLTVLGLESGGRDDLLPWTRNVALRICHHISEDCRGA